MAPKSAFVFLAAASSVLWMLWPSEQEQRLGSVASALEPVQKVFRPQDQSLPAPMRAPAPGQPSTLAPQDILLPSNGPGKPSQHDHGMGHEIAPKNATEIARTPARPAGSSLPGPARLRGYGRLPAGGKPMGETPEAAPLTLDLGLGSVLPAVLAAPETPVNTSPGSGAEMKPAAAAAAALFNQFIESNTQPQPAQPGQDPAEVADQHWQATAKLADERYRSLFGKEAFLRQSMQAARVLREAPPAH